MTHARAAASGAATPETEGQEQRGEQSSVAWPDGDSGDEQLTWAPQACIARPPTHLEAQPQQLHQLPLPESIQQWQRRRCRLAAAARRRPLGRLQRPQRRLLLVAQALQEGSKGGEGMEAKVLIRGALQGERREKREGEGGSGWPSR